MGRRFQGHASEVEHGKPALRQLGRVPLERNTPWNRVRLQVFCFHVLASTLPAWRWRPQAYPMSWPAPVVGAIMNAVMLVVL